MFYKLLPTFIQSALVSLTVLAFSASATVVTIETNMGEIVVNLYDQSTPATVENFLDYVNKGKYDQSIVHRSIEDFVVQAGAYKWSIEGEQEKEQANPIELRQIEQGEDSGSTYRVKNEPLWSNLKGTIAMAKTSAEHSATSSWFINLSDDNAPNLDLQSRGFTVFGEVTEGMSVVEAMNGLPTYSLNSALTAFPLQSFDGESEITTEHLVYITRVTVTDTSIDSAKNLTPTPNTLIYQENIDLIDEVANRVKEDVNAVEGYLTRAEAAYTIASEISAESGKVAASAKTSIEQSLIELDQLLAQAEQYVIDAENAESNGDSVLAIVDIRDLAAETYFAASDEADAALEQVIKAEAVAVREETSESSGGGSLSWFWLTLCAVIFARRVKGIKA